MSWGSAFMYYVCPRCGKKFRYNIDLIGALGARFGLCPVCGATGDLQWDGPLTEAGTAYEEIE